MVAAGDQPVTGTRTVTDPGTGRTFHIPTAAARPGDIAWHAGLVQLVLGVIDGKWTVVEAANLRTGVRIDQTGWMNPQAVLRPAGGEPPLQPCSTRSAFCALTFRASRVIGKARRSRRSAALVADPVTGSDRAETPG